MAKKKKTRARKFAKQRSGKAAVLPAASLASRLTRPVAAAPATKTTYYLELADIALGGKSNEDSKKKDEA